MVNSPIRVRLQTIGRKSGRLHTVRITAVLHEGEYYFSRHRPDSDWFLNAIHNPAVTILLNNNDMIKGRAEQVYGTSLISLISSIKYPNDPRAKERRVAIRVIPVKGTI